jgi:hypothetical protein
LSNITIPASIASFGASSFSGCDLLNSITIPHGVTNIGPGAFAYSGLNSIRIPGSVMSIGEGAFGYCVLLTSATIEDGVTSIGSSAFIASGLTSITIPGSVTNITAYAFGGCPQLQTVTIENGVTSIADYAFNLGGLEGNLTIPSSVINIGAGAFSYNNLNGVFFAGNPPSVAPDAFAQQFLVTFYYLAGANGWSNPPGLPNPILWNPLIQAGSAEFAVQNNQFGFTITNSTTNNIPIVVEACTNLASPVWIPLQTLTLTNSFYFSDPDWTNYPARYYGLGFP